METQAPGFSYFLLQSGDAIRRGQRLGWRGREIFAGIDELVTLEFVLLVVELFVPAISREQLLVCATFDDLSAFQDQNLIGAANR